MKITKILSVGIIAVFGFFCSQHIRGQVTLVSSLSITKRTTMPEYGTWEKNLNLYRVDEHTIGSDTYTIKFYDIDLSLNKTVSLPIGNSTSGVNTFKDVHCSKYLFNNDDKIEILFIQTGRLRLYNEDGDLLHDFGTATPAAGGANVSWQLEIFKYNGTYYLKMLRSGPAVNGYTIETYQLSGTGDDSTNEIVYPVQTFANPFPNPATATINLPYKLEQNEISVMYIYNANGQFITEKQIDGIFDRILLDISNYQSGIYFYKVKDTINKFIVN